jgi:effector-binding domain-containing protein
MPADRIPIARFSAITKISQKALRYYDRKGILVPEAKDPFTGYRYYTASQMERGVKVRALCSLGFSLEDVTAYLEAVARDDRETVDCLLKKQLFQVRSELLRLQRIEALLQGDRKELIGMALTEPVIKEVPALRVLSKRERGNLSATIGKLIGELCAVAYLPANQRNQMKVTGPVMALYYEDCEDGDESFEDWSKKEVDIEVALPVTGKVEVSDPKMELKSLPAARVLSLVHKGSYTTLYQSYQAVFEHMAKSKLEVAGTVRELYLNDPSQNAEEDLMTEIQIPVRRGA